MSKDRPLAKVTLNLYEGDMQELQALYPDVGAGAVIRRLVDAYLNQIRKGGEANLNAEVEIKI